jgi:hypothetical protein
MRYGVVRVCPQLPLGKLSPSQLSVGESQQSFSAPFPRLILSELPDYVSGEFARDVPASHPDKKHGLRLLWHVVCLSPFGGHYANGKVPLVVLIAVVSIVFFHRFSFFL